VIRTVIADDSAPMRTAIAALLERDGRFAVCAAAADAAGAVAAAVRERPHLCLLDVRMPGGGVAAAWEIAARLPETTVVMLTVSEEETDVRSALHAGAAGYLLKDMDLLRLPAALLDVVQHRAPALPRRLLARVLADYRDRDPRRRCADLAHPDRRLTSREWQVLDRLRAERSTAQIAGELSLTPATVRSHVMTLTRKLGVADRRALLELFEPAP
jgi:DNA-binding NarL/FixJ family response regulator